MEALRSELADNLTPAQLQNFQDCHLQLLIDNCYRNVAALEPALEADLVAAGLPIALIRILQIRGVVGSAGTGIDTTVAYLTACLTPFDADKLRRGVDLSCLEEPLSPRLPLQAIDADFLFKDAAELQDLLVSAAQDPQAAAARALCRHVVHVMTFIMSAGTSEANTSISVAAVVEQTLLFILRYVPGPRIRVDRNTADTSGATGKRLRPDFMCWVNGALLFKGEEKASGAEMELAILELKEKLSVAWDEGMLPGVQPPCMLAYAAAAQQLQFFCIKRSGGASEPLVQPISAVIDLRFPVGRARALNATCNVYRLMVGFAGALPNVLHFALGAVIKSGPSSVMLLHGYVRKTIHGFLNTHVNYTTFELLQAVYAAMSKPEHKGSIIQACGIGGDAGPTLRHGNYVVHLAPVGTPVSGPPDNERDLARAVRGALVGLAALHSEGFVHRDVRWPNLIKLPADNRWLLVDLEHAGREGDDCSQPPYPLRYWSSDMLEPNGAYTTASDLKMVGRQLLSSLPFLLSGEGLDLQQRLCNGTISAVEALQHSWFDTHA